MIDIQQQKYARISVAHVPGPKPESFILGNLPEIFQSQAGIPDFKYQREFGDVVRVKGAFGEDRLLISDPKALQYIFHTSGYGFLKWPERTEISRVLMGRGLLWADGDIHKRQRKVMLPGFGAPESKAFIPIFQKVGGELTAQWTDILASSPDQTAEFNVATWLSRATMDSIGEGIFSSHHLQHWIFKMLVAAFDYQFGALAQTDNEFMKAYFGLMRRNLVHARHTANLANDVARALVKSKAGALLEGKNNKDILSLLVRANASENEATQLTEEEMLAQMRTILLAGHETSATSLCWVLLELARHPEWQQKLRDEIRSTELASGRKYSSFTASDLDGMECLAAILKESMRFHPALYQNYRQAAKDDVLPLSTPIKTASGEYSSDLPIPKGMKVILSIAGYHRNKEVFGDDADIFNPDRWLRKSEEKKGPKMGVYGNLLTFAGGVRSCIGWRFALYEVQSLCVEIINNFELLPTPQLERLRREACLVMLPTLEVSSSRALYNTTLLRATSSTQSNPPRPDSIFSGKPNWLNDTPQRTSRPPRQAMTARESNAFNEMFSMIFDAAAAHEKSHPAGSAFVGVGKDGIDDLIGKLRKYPKRLKWSTEVYDILDRQKEVINLFSTDQELLAWATDAVFGESQRYEEAARKAITDAAASGTKVELPMLQPPTYPHLVALIMEAFRDKFKDPHLAISMFEHARNLSIASYVFGCSSQAYHELIATRWKCFEDLKGVHDALQEMRVNGVKVSAPTQRLVEKLRREVGKKHLWVDESEIGSGEVWNLLAQIEDIALSGRVSRNKRKPITADVKWDNWKAADPNDETDDWGFDEWHSKGEEKGPVTKRAESSGSNGASDKDWGFDEWDLKPRSKQDNWKAAVPKNEKDGWGFDEWLAKSEETGPVTKGAELSGPDGTSDKDWVLDEWDSKPHSVQTTPRDRRARNKTPFGLKPIPDDAEPSVGISSTESNFSQDDEDWGLDQAAKEIERLEKAPTSGGRRRRRRFGLTASQKNAE
ncbi:hypothetical protein H0H92_002304 [Tricholoma furcatifolium]|nr:hypothetical protein H0H92_002304 [Tricholoma furcatifolium]